jgi:hypothetical protein
MAFETVTGYCWPQSVGQGEPVAVHVSSAGGRPVAMEVAHVGAARTVMFHASAIEAGDHPTPSDASEAGCNWPVATEILTGPDWPSGYYEVLLTIDLDGKRRQSRAFFVVRPDLATTTARILWALDTNTWHAYNDFGGRNLYTGATRVSLRRPMAPGYLFKPPGAGQRVTSLHPPDRRSASHVGYLMLHHLSPWAGSAGWPNWSLPFAAWAGSEGYAIDVVTNADLDEHPELLGTDSPYSLYLSIGHDEYWSAPMRDTVEGFIAQGGHAAFLSGNTAFWQVRFEDPSGDDGTGPASVMVGYKAQFKRDPVFGTDRQAELTTIWSDHLVERPENLMTGVSFSRGGYHRIGKRVTRGAGGYTVHRPGHWMFDGTDLDYGDVLGAAATVVGYECDGCEFTYRDGLPHPTGNDGTPTRFEILGTAPAAHFTRTTASRPPAPHEPSEVEFIASRLFNDRSPAAVERIAHGHAVLGSYVSAAGGTVITSGCTDWVWGLAGRDADVEQITRNILNRLGG